MRSHSFTVSTLGLALALGACSSRSLDDYESGTGGDAGSASGGTSNTGGTSSTGGASGSGGTANTGGSGGTSNTGGSGGTSNTGGSGGTSNTGGSGGATGGAGGSGGSTGGAGGATGGTGGTGGATGGTGGATGGTGGATGGTGGATGGTGGATGGTGGSGGTTSNPVCGNNKLEAGEECDDGNKTAGDGCSATCQVVCTDVVSGAKSYTASGRVHCYWAIVGSNSWTDSQDKCQNAYAKKGHLVSITSSGENGFVQQNFASSNSVWIGGTDGQAISSATQGTYGWVNGEAISSYVNFDTSEPDWASCGTGCTEHRLIMQTSGKWADTGVNSSHVGVCEWEPPP